MTISDILIYETGNGGDLLLLSNDIATVTGYENSPYLAMFSGNNWWGNCLQNPANQFLSKTEDILKITPLTSSGRVAITDAIKSDLSYLDDIPGTTWTVDLSIAGPDRLDIIIKINGKVFSYSWDPNKMFLTYQV